MAVWISDREPSEGGDDGQCGPHGIIALSSSSVVWFFLSFFLLLLLLFFLSFFSSFSSSAAASSSYATLSWFRRLASLGILAVTNGGGFQVMECAKTDFFGYRAMNSIQKLLHTVCNSVFDDKVWWSFRSVPFLVLMCRLFHLQEVYRLSLLREARGAGKMLVWRSAVMVRWCV